MARVGIHGPAGVMLSVAVAVLAVAVVVLGVMVVSLLRSHGEVLRTLHDLGITLDPERPDDAAALVVGRDRGEPRPHRDGTGRATDVEGTTPWGDPVTVAVTPANHRTLLVFLTSGCLTCRSIWTALVEGAEAPGGARLVVVTKGLHEESPAEIVALAPESATVVASSGAWEDYGVHAAPYFVLVDGTTGSVVGEGTSPDWSQLQRLVLQALADTHVDDRLRADPALGQVGIGPGHPSLHAGRDPRATSGAGGDG